MSDLCYWCGEYTKVEVINYGKNDCKYICNPCRKALLINSRVEAEKKDKIKRNKKPTKKQLSWRNKREKLLDG